MSKKMLSVHSWKLVYVFQKDRLRKTRLFSGFPLRLENQEKLEGIFESLKSQGILNKLEKSGKITQNTENKSDLLFLMIF